MGGRTNQVTQKFHGTKFKSSNLRVEWQTEPFLSALVKNLSPTTNGAKFMSFYQRVEGQTKLLMGALVEI